jgi:hypothetical protein
VWGGQGPCKDYRAADDDDDDDDTILSVNSDYFLQQRNKLMFIMMAVCVLFEVRTQFLNII